MSSWAAESDRPRVLAGRYTIGRRIGVGGMAVVDVARQAGPGGGRLVALKRMASALSKDPAARRLFLREASIATRIEHPNVVRTYEVGEADWEAFIAMELLEGATLAELVRAAPGRVPLPIALRIAADALRGLHAVHELRGPGGEALGLVHQDISPQNVHVAYEGTTRILDFGVARIAAIDATRTDSIRGKACYLAPEQVSLERIDQRADIFAAGIVLYEMLTGVPLFPRGRPEAVHAAILSGKIPRPSATFGDIPEAIDAVVSRALSMAKDDRFASAADMRRALLDAQARAGIQAADVAAVGAWVQETVPATWSRADLERELNGVGKHVSAPDTNAELATLPPRRAASASRRPSDNPRPSLWLVALVASIVTLGLGLASLLMRPRAATSQPAPMTASATPSQPSTEVPSREPEPVAPVPRPAASSPGEPTSLVSVAAPVHPPERLRVPPHGSAPRPNHAPAAATAPVDPLATQ